MPAAAVHLSHDPARRPTSNKYEHKSERLLGLTAVWSVCFVPFSVFCVCLVLGLLLCLVLGLLVFLVLGLFVCAYEYFCVMYAYRTGSFVF